MPNLFARLLRPKNKSRVSSRSQTTEFRGLSSLREKYSLDHTIKLGSYFKAPAATERRATGHLRNLGSGIRKVARAGIIRPKNLVLLILLAGAIAVVGYGLYKSGFWVVTKVSVTGASSYSSELVQSIQSELTGQNLLQLNLNNYQQRLEADPYISKSFLQKRYPGEVSIQIVPSQPTAYLSSLNELILFDDAGKIIATESTEDKINLTEIERLIYLEEKAFKNEQVYEAWLRENQPRLLTEYIALQPLSKPTVIELESGEAQALLNSQGFSDYATKQYNAVPISDISNLYKQARAEVNLIIEQHQQTQIAKAKEELNLPIIHSLLDTAATPWLQNPSEVTNLLELDKQLAELGLTVEKREIISLTTILLRCKRNDGKDDLRVLLKESGDYGLALTKLRSVLLELDTAKQEFRQIDVRGQKVVVT